MSSLLARRYASALFEVGKEQSLLDEFHLQFKEIVNQLSSEDRFEKLINSPQITIAEKKDIFKVAFKDMISPYLLNFIYVVFDKGRQSHFLEIFSKFQEMVYNYKGILSARVVSAIALREDQILILKHKLSKQFNKEIIIENKIDPSIIGGLVVYAGDKILDGSIKSKLSKLKADLKEIRLQEIGVI